MTRTIHLICNAHLDPVWLWEWEEGATEAISTFRVAAELAERSSTFVFNHNEALLYHWVEQYEPSLFRRIQKLVRQGKWNIMGGWWLQPDCNLPHGESFVRQILLGKRFFKDRFGVDVTTAINFDSFGHTRGLVQILARSGYNAYMMMRPKPRQKPLPENGFVWVGFDGSEILTCRFDDCYNSPLGHAVEAIERRIEQLNHDDPVGVVLWGVGNHGGGPSRQDLKEVDRLIRSRKDIALSHSRPQDYFRELFRSKTFHRVPDDLNRWAIGCYTSMIRIKQAHRELENRLFAAEKMAAAAAANGLRDYPRDRFTQAMQDLATSQFHDALPGSGVPGVEEGTLRQLARGLQIVDEEQFASFIALNAGQRKPRDGEIPIMVYNPHPFPVTQFCQCEFDMPDFAGHVFRDISMTRNGRPLSCQVEKEAASLSHYNIDWRKRVAFHTTLQPGMNRFDTTSKTLKKRPTPQLKPRNNRLRFKTAELEVEVNTRTGLVDRCRAHGRHVFDAGAFRVLALQDTPDSWQGNYHRFDTVKGRFTLMNKKEGTAFSGVTEGTLDSVRVIEDGPVRSIIESVFRYNDSFLCTRLKLPKTGTAIEVELRVFFNEKDTILKLAIPTLARDSRFLGQTAYGVQPLLNDGDEVAAQKWVAVVSEKDDLAVTVVNDGTYGVSCEDGELRLSLLRSAAYSTGSDVVPPALPQDRFSPRMEQGERCFRFWLNAGPVRQRLDAIDREALTLNEQPYALSFFPPGDGRKPKPMAVLTDEVVQIPAIKQADQGRAWIVRLFEPTGRGRKTRLKLPTIGMSIPVSLGPFELKTLRIDPQRKSWKEVDLLETRAAGSTRLSVKQYPEDYDPDREDDADTSASQRKQDPHRPR